MNVEQIAHVAHETNRAYCETLGDHSQKPWAEAEEWQRESAISNVRFHLESHANGEQPSSSAAHNAWLADKQAAGWIYGPVKDADKKEHPCILPYDQLPVDQRLKDYLFAAVVSAFVNAHAVEVAREQIVRGCCNS